MKPFLALLLLFFSYAAFSQTKYEKEIRVKSNEVPQLAVSFIDSLPFDQKIKWYRETGLERINYEAKTRFRDSWFSVEFLNDGALKDIEVLLDYNALPEMVLRKVDLYFLNKYQKFNADRVQKQYSGSRENLFELVKNYPEEASVIVIQYEIVITAKVAGAFQTEEYLFSADGDFISSSRVVNRITDNIEY